MKMIVLFLFVFISGVFAGNANSQETKVSISKNNKPIREILGEIVALIGENGAGKTTLLNQQRTHMEQHAQGKPEE